MAKDKRLWMRFPITFDEHPKVEQLSDKAFRVFFAMNGYSRRLELDGVIPVKLAVKKWGRKPLTELVDSDAVKPLVRLDGENYVITSYAEHQQTKADSEALAAKRSAAGKKAMAKRWQNDSKPITSVIANGLQVDSKAVTEQEKDKEQELTTLNSESYVNSRASNLLTQDEVGQLRVRKSTYASLGIKDPVAVQAELAARIGRDVNELETFRIVVGIMSKSSGLIKSPQAYVLSSIRSSWAELQKQFDEGEFETPDGGDAA